LNNPPARLIGVEDKKTTFSTIPGATPSNVEGWGEVKIKEGWCEVKKAAPFGTAFI